MKTSTQGKYSRYKRGRMIVTSERKTPGLPESVINSHIKIDRDRRRSIVKDRMLTALGVSAVYLVLAGLFHLALNAQYSMLGVFGFAVGSVIYQVSMALFDCHDETGKAFDIDDWR